MANFKLTQTGEQIQADLDLLDKNSATQGQVLTANGTGGASWQNASGGSGGGTQPNTFTVTVHNTVTSGTGFLYIISYENGVFTQHTASSVGDYTINNALLIFYEISNSYDLSIVGETIMVYQSPDGSRDTSLITGDCVINVSGGGGN